MKDFYSLRQLFCGDGWCLDYLGYMNVLCVLKCLCQSFCVDGLCLDYLALGGLVDGVCERDRGCLVMIFCVSCRVGCFSTW